MDDWDKTPWKNWHRWPSSPPVFYLEKAKEEEPKESVPPRLPTWAEFQVVWDDTGEPIRGVHLVIEDSHGHRNVCETGPSRRQPDQRTHRTHC
jgi:hypothetical protein